MLNRIILTILLTLSFSLFSLADNDGSSTSTASSISIDFIEAKQQTGEAVCYLFFMNTGNVDLGDIEVSLSNPDGFSSEDLGINKLEFSSTDLSVKQFMSLGDIEANGATTFWAPFSIPNGREVKFDLKVETSRGTFYEEVKFAMLNGKVSRY